MDCSTTRTLTPGEKSIYGAGGFVANLMGNAVFRLASPVLNIGLHVSPELVGLAMFLPRIWSAVTDPVIGRISDNTRSRWGRRRPFIFVGALATGLMAGLVFLGPADGGEWGYFLWFLVCSLLYYTASSVFIVPYLALGNEMSPNYHERTSINGYRAAGMYLAGLINQGLPFFVGMACWGGITQGARMTGWILMGLMAAIGGAVGFASRERYFRLVQGQGTVRLCSVLRDICNHRSFVALAGASLLYWVGIAMVDSLGVYINVYYVAAESVQGNFAEVRQAGFEYQFYNGIVQHGVSLLLLPVVTGFSRRCGKIQTLQLGLLLTAVASALKIVCYTPALWQLQLIVPLLMGPSQSCFIVVTGSLMADLMDEDELRTGWRREGVYGAMMSWLQKIGVAVAVMLSSFVLGWAGFLAARESNQAPGVILVLRWSYALLPILTCLGAATVLRYYTLDESKAQEIRGELQRRRGMIGRPIPAPSGA